MLVSATRICEAKFGNLLLREADAFHGVAWHGEPTYVPRGEARIIKTDVAGHSSRARCGNEETRSCRGPQAGSSLQGWFYDSCRARR